MKMHHSHVMESDLGECVKSYSLLTLMIFYYGFVQTVSSNDFVLPPIPMQGFLFLYMLLLGLLNYVNI